MRENLLVIDPDKLAAEGLSPIAAGKAAARMAHLFLEEGVSFARESTLTARFDFTLMAKAKQRGYKIELVYICLASEMLALKLSCGSRVTGDIEFRLGMLSAVLAAALKICQKLLRWRTK